MHRSYPMKDRHASLSISISLLHLNFKYSFIILKRYLQFLGGVNPLNSTKITELSNDLETISLKGNYDIMNLIKTKIVRLCSFELYNAVKMVSGIKQV